MKRIVFMVLLFSFSCGVVRTGEEGLQKYTLKTTVIENVEHCESLIKRDALRPQVCGRCKITFDAQRKRLIVAETEECVPYDSYGCATSFGETFLINTLSCKPLSEKLPKVQEQPTIEQKR
ncbi:hypothetical protein [Thermocrinis sp.]